MNPDREALSYVLRKIYFRFVKKLVSKNYPLDEILKELKKVGLEAQKARVQNLKRYIKSELEKEWDDKKNEWKDSAEQTFFDEGSDEIIDDDILLILSEDDAKTLLKDMKYILSNSKKIVRDIEKLTTDIDVITAAIRSKYNTEQ